MSQRATASWLIGWGMARVTETVKSLDFGLSALAFARLKNLRAFVDARKVQRPKTKVQGRLAPLFKFYLEN